MCVYVLYLWYPRVNAQAHKAIFVMVFILVSFTISVYNNYFTTLHIRYLTISLKTLSAGWWNRKNTFSGRQPDTSGRLVLAVLAVFLAGSSLAASSSSEDDESSSSAAPQSNVARYAAYCGSDGQSRPISGYDWQIMWRNGKETRLQKLEDQISLFFFHCN